MKIYYILRRSVNKRDTWKKSFVKCGLIERWTEEIVWRNRHTCWTISDIVSYVNLKFNGIRTRAFCDTGAALSSTELWSHSGVGGGANMNGPKVFPFVALHVIISLWKDIFKHTCLFSFAYWWYDKLAWFHFFFCVRFWSLVWSDLS